jgi:hypothetical protein
VKQHLKVRNYYYYFGKLKLYCPNSNFTTLR